MGFNFCTQMNQLYFAMYLIFNFISLSKCYCFSACADLMILFYYTLHWTQTADGHLGLSLSDRWLFGAGLNGRVSHLGPVTSPGLKFPTQSQMADGYLKVCVQNAKIVFHMNFRTFPNFGKF